MDMYIITDILTVKKGIARRNFQSGFIRSRTQEGYCFFTPEVNQSSVLCIRDSQHPLL